MQTMLILIARLAGLAGVALCAVAFIVRLTGTWTIGSVQVGSMLQAGMAGMLLGCLAYCAALAERSRG